MTKLVLFLLATAIPGWSAEWIAYVGSYTGPNNKGVHAYRFDDASGKLTDAGLAAESSNPSFLAVSPNHRFVYAVNEDVTYDGKPTGSISAFSVGANAALKLLNIVSSRGAGPCHLALDQTGKWLFAANYNSGSVAAFRIHDDGSLGEAEALAQHAGSSVNPQRQSGPHAHSANISPDGRFVLAVDLGLDKILTYRIDSAKGPLTPANPPFIKVAPGSGPRHLAFAPSGKFAYAINELAGTVTAFRYDSTNGSLKEFQTISTLPPGFSGVNYTAEIVVHPSGKFLYASNRGHDSVAIIRIDPANGRLTAAGHVPTQGHTPRNFSLDPSGKFLLVTNQDSGNIVVFRIEQATGALTPSGESANLASPASIVFVPAGK